MEASRGGTHSPDSKFKVSVKWPSGPHSFKIPRTSVTGDSRAFSTVMFRSDGRLFKPCHNCSGRLLSCPLLISTLSSKMLSEASFSNQTEDRTRDNKTETNKQPVQFSEWHSNLNNGILLRSSKLKHLYCVTTAPLLPKCHVILNYTGTSLFVRRESNVF